MVNINVRKRKIGKDGNCFFRGVSFYFNDNEDYYVFYRVLLYLYCKKKVIIKYMPINLLIIMEIP